MAALVYPELYAKASKFSINQTAYILNKYKYLIQWKKSPSILDVGFGEGSSAKHNLFPLFPKDYKEFVGTDLSDEMINFAKKNVVLPKSKFCQMDITNIHNEFKGRFDNIFSFMVLHLVKDCKKAFCNIKKMLKPGGETFCTFLVQSPLDPVFTMLSKHPKWKIYSQEKMISPFNFEKNPSACYKKAVEDGGFKDIYYEVEDITHEFENVQAAYDLSLAVNAIMPYVPDKELEEYKKCYLDAINTNVLSFNEQRKNEDGSFRPEIKFSLSVVHARNT